MATKDDWWKRAHTDCDAELAALRASLAETEGRLATERLTGYLLGHEDGVLLCQKVIDYAVALIGHWDDPGHRVDLAHAVFEFGQAQKEYQEQQAQPAARAQEETNEPS